MNKRFRDFFDAAKAICKPQKFDPAETLLDLNSSRFVDVRWESKKTGIIPILELKYHFESPYELPGKGNQFSLWEEQFSRVQNYIDATGNTAREAIQHAAAAGHIAAQFVGCEPVTREDVLSGGNQALDLAA